MSVRPRASGPVTAESALDVGTAAPPQHGGSGDECGRPGNEENALIAGGHGQSQKNGRQGQIAQGRAAQPLDQRPAADDHQGDEKHERLAVPDASQHRWKQKQAQDDGPPQDGRDAVSAPDTVHVKREGAGRKGGRDRAQKGRRLQSRQQRQQRDEHRRQRGEVERPDQALVAPRPAQVLAAGRRRQVAGDRGPLTGLRAVVPVERPAPQDARADGERQDGGQHVLISAQ